MLATAFWASCWAAQVRQRSRRAGFPGLPRGETALHYHGFGWRPLCATPPARRLEWRAWTVDLHPKLIHLKRVFASKLDPRVDPFLPINRAGGQRSDRRGDIECDQTLACTRGHIDSRDQQADEAVAQYDPEALGERRSGGGLSEAQEPEQTGRMCCNFQESARERLVGSTWLRLMQPPRTVR